MNYTAGNLIVAAAPRAPRPRQRTRVIGNKRNLTAVESRFTKVPVAELQLGMFIAELDRPWLETPFLIQGFVLCEFGELRVLRDHCKYVYIDAGKSAPIGYVQQQQRPLGKSISETFSARRLTRYDDHVSFDEEMESAKRIYADYESTVARLYDTEFLGQQVNMQQVSEAVGNIVDSIIRNPDACTLLHKMKRKGDYLYNHAIGMSVWAAALSRQIGLPPNEIKRIAMGALLCDIGKVGISNRILDKPGKLTEAEFEQVKRHVIIDDNFMERFPGLSNAVLEIIQTHHERHDGSGYPRGLSADDVPVYSRIVAIADCYDALTNDRPYGRAISPTQACRVLYELRDIHYQGEIVEEFIQAVGVYPVGTLVELNTGEVGVVISEYRKRRLRPKLLLLLDAGKQPITSTRYLNLMDCQVTDRGERIEIKCALNGNAYGLDADDFFQ